MRLDRAPTALLLTSGACRSGLREDKKGMNPLWVPFKKVAHSTGFRGDIHPVNDPHQGDLQLATNDVQLVDCGDLITLDDVANIAFRQPRRCRNFRHASVLAGYFLGQSVAHHV